MSILVWGIEFLFNHDYLPPLVPLRRRGGHEKILFSTSPSPLGKAGMGSILSVSLT
jgi:hypothetical protein